MANPTSITSTDSYLLTSLGWRSVGYAKCDTNLEHPNSNLVDPDKGTKWMTMQFQLSVGEKIYGLGERFGNFVKNGQVRSLLPLAYSRLIILTGYRDVERRRRHFIRIDV